MKAKTAWTIALAVVTPFLWWGTYRTFKPFDLSDLSGYDWSMVRFEVGPESPRFSGAIEYMPESAIRSGSDGVKTMTVYLFYETLDRASLHSKARSVCLRCAAEMRRLLPNEHRTVKLAVYGVDSKPLPPEKGACLGRLSSVGDLTIDDPTRKVAIPVPKEEWH
jgi:hypothetical protein